MLHLSGPGHQVASAKRVRLTPGNLPAVQPDGLAWRAQSRHTRPALVPATWLSQGDRCTVYKLGVSRQDPAEPADRRSADFPDELQRLATAVDLGQYI